MYPPKRSFLVICLLPVVLFLLMWALDASGLTARGLQQLRSIFSIFWFFPAISAIACAIEAASIEDAPLDEKAVELLADTYVPLDKDATWTPDPTWREARLAEIREGFQALHWKCASRWWRFATGCALASVFMLAVAGWHCLHW